MMPPLWPFVCLFQGDLAVQYLLQRIFLLLALPVESKQNTGNVVNQAEIPQKK